MAIFCEQPIFCPACGKSYLGKPTNPVCSRECHDELNWKRTLYIMGKNYYRREETS